MKLNHIHVQVRDLGTAIRWFETVLQVKPVFGNERLAALPFGEMTLILDAGSNDIPAALGFQSEDCDFDFQTVIDRGAVALEPPSNKEWGVRAAYFKGPGALKCEIEGPATDS